MSTDSDYADSVSRILLQQGQAQAQGKLGAGQAWGHFAGQLGQIAQTVGQQYQDRQAQEQEARLRATQQRQTQQRLDQDQRRSERDDAQQFSKQQIHDAAEKAYGQIKDGNADAVLSMLPPESRVMAEGWLGEVQKAKQDRDAQGIALGKQTAKFIQANSYDPVTSVTALKVLADVHPGAKDALEHADDPAAFRKLIDHFATIGDKPDAPYTLNSGDTRFSGANEPVAVGGAKPVEPISPYQQATLGQSATNATEAARHHRAMENRPAASLGAGGMGGMNALTDPQAIADGIRRGEMPPDISQYGRPVQGAVASFLAKPTKDGQPPFQLANAQRIYASQKRLNSTMNGAQQVRLDESIKSGLAMYDKVDEISDRWKGMGLGPLSRANLKVAMEGGKGPEAAQIANELTGQIGQLTSDIATIEQGGLTPTNESRAVAEKSMQAWWGDRTIKAMTAQGRANMRIRETARADQGTFTAGNTDRSGAPMPSVVAPAEKAQTAAEKAAALLKKYGGG